VRDRGISAIGAVGDQDRLSMVKDAWHNVWQIATPKALL
jgi:hypothetical protein